MNVDTVVITCGITANGVLNLTYFVMKRSPNPFKRVSPVVPITPIYTRIDCERTINNNNDKRIFDILFCLFEVFKLKLL